MISSTGMRRAVAPWLLVLGGMDLGGLPGTGGRPRAYADDSAAVGSYDPAAIAENAVSETHELTVNDAARNRNIALRVVLPSPRPAAPAPRIPVGRVRGEHGSRWARQRREDLMGF